MIKSRKQETANGSPSLQPIVLIRQNGVNRYVTENVPTEDSPKALQKNYFVIGLQLQSLERVPFLRSS